MICVTCNTAPQIGEKRGWGWDGRIYCPPCLVEADKKFFAEIDAEALKRKRAAQKRLKANTGES